MFDSRPECVPSMTDSVPGIHETGFIPCQTGHIDDPAVEPQEALGQWECVDGRDMVDTAAIPLQEECKHNWRRYILQPKPEFQCT